MLNIFTELKNVTTVDVYDWSMISDWKLTSCLQTEKIKHITY